MIVCVENKDQVLFEDPVRGGFANYATTYTDRYPYKMETTTGKFTFQGHFFLKNLHTTDTCLQDTVDTGLDTVTI